MSYSLDKQTIIIALFYCITLDMMAVAFILQWEILYPSVSLGLVGLIDLVLANAEWNRQFISSHTERPVVFLDQPPSEPRIIKKIVVAERQRNSVLGFFTSISLFAEIVHTLKEQRGLDDKITYVLDSSNSYFSCPVVRSVSSIGGLPRAMQTSMPDNHPLRLAVARGL
jgi:hypothetical protein